jgi:glucose-1-phosphate cytidylyltransferase
MKAVILCGGRGVIDPHTGARIPKGMMRVGDWPVISHVMKTLSMGGVRDFVIALGEHGEVIRDYLEQSKDCSDWHTECIDTGTHVETGFRLVQCQPSIGDGPFLLTYCDCLCNIRADDLVSYHKRREKTLTVTGVQPQWRFGVFRTMGNEVISYNPQPHLVSDQGYINGGYMVAEPRIFDHIRAAPDCSLERETFTELARDRQVAVYLHAGYWQAIDGERDLEIVNAFPGNARPWLFESDACHAS